MNDRKPSLDTNKPRSPRHHSPLVSGVLLMAAGVGLLMINLGYGIPPAVWEYWPLVFIALGIIGILAPSRHLSRSGAVWLLAAGAYCEISTLRLFGLEWSSAWPIFIIAAGLSMIFRESLRGDSGYGTGPGVGDAGGDLGSGMRGNPRSDKGGDKVLHEA